METVNDSMGAFGSQPVPPAAGVKNPAVDPSSWVPLGFSPSTIQMTMWPTGHEGFGEQVSAVLPPLQTGVAARGWEVVPSMKVAVVRLAFMASLNVMTNGAVGETPVAMLAGTVERMVGAACAPHQLSGNTKPARRQRRRLREAEGWDRLIERYRLNDSVYALRLGFVAR